MVNKIFYIVRVFHVVILFCAIVLLSSCHSNESADNTEFTDGGTVTNSDGKASSNIPAGVKAYPVNTRVMNSRLAHGIIIRWQLVPGATSYNIYWSTTPDVKVSGNKITDVTSPYTHEDLIFGETYYYIVTAVKNSVEEEASLETATLPGMDYISGGSEHVAVLKNDGTVWTWGLNTWGQLGDGTMTDSPTPVQVQGMTDVIAVAADRRMTMALKSDGTVWTWGENSYGVLVDESESGVERASPRQVIGLTDVVAIATGWSAGMALKSDGTVWTWGENEYGTLGDGTIEDRYTPVQVIGLTEIVSISAKRSHVLALKSDGTIWAWGHNRHGQHGNDTATGDANSPGPVPVQVSDLKDQDVSIAAGYWHSMAMKGDGTVWTWGRNEASELCDGTSIDKSIPGKISGLPDVLSLMGGEGYTIFLKRDGTVWMCGNNSTGLLGIGESMASIMSAPEQVTDLSDVVAITSGRYFAVALKRDGTLWTWGYNDKGQLGDGTTYPRYAPVQVLMDPLF
ncbi:MAG TPA: hypothetical protein VFF47_00775 [Nitrospirota bacterium]|nr:hypothetical protein [Nitrospirota bacterium]